MSHIHIPDGTMPVAFWLIGYILTILVLAFIVKTLDKEKVKKIIPYTGVAAALMLISMSVPLFIVPVHISLAVLIGILLGPKLGIIVAFIVSMILALFGHGGITIVGLNTIIMSVEIVIGAYVFRGIGLKKPVFAAVMATIIGVLVSLVLMVTIVGAGVSFAEVLPHQHTHNEEDAHEEEDEEHSDEQHEEEHDEEEHESESFLEKLNELDYLAFSGGIALILIVIIGIAIEAAFTGLLVKYFNKVKPELLEMVHEK